MRLIVTEKDNSAKKIAQILSGGKAKQNKSYGIPHYSWDGSDGGTHRDRPQGPPDEPRLPGGLLRLAQDRAARADLREPREGAAPEERSQGAAQAGQGRELDRDRDRLRPRGRADRPRGARGDAGREPRPAQRVRGSGAAGRQARPVLGVDQGGDRACVLQPRRAVRAAGSRRRGAPGHRPDLGRDADAFHLARDRPPGVAVPVRRPCAEPDPGDRGAARAGAPRARREALLGGVRRVRASPTASSRRTTRWTSSGTRPRRRLRSPARPARASSKSVESKRNTRRPPAPFNTTAFTSASSSVGRVPGARDAHRGGPLHGRVHLLSADRQHRLPEVAPGARVAEVDLAGARVQGGGAARRARDPRAHARQEGDHRPPTDLPDAGARPERAARRRPSQDLRAGGAPLPGDVRRPVGVRVDAGRHRGRVADLLRARQRARRARVPRGLSIRAVEGRGDPEGGGGPADSARARALGRREGDPAAVAHRPGQADRDDGGARPRHEGHAPRHHPEALRPRLHPGQPDRAAGDGHRDGEGVPALRRDGVLART